MTVQNRVNGQPAAQAVEAAPTGLLQRKCSCGQHTRGGICESCALKKAAQRSVGASVGTSGLPRPVQEVLRSPGRRLDGATRGFMETRFGHDFAQVRVHTGERAETSADAISARAYTVGDNIVLGAGAYAPGTRAGLTLIAHELAHTLQNRRSSAPAAKSLLGEQRDPAEQEADRIAETVMSGPGAIPEIQSAPAARVQRDCGPTDIGTPAGCDPQPSTFIAGQHLAKFTRDCNTFATPTERTDLVAFAGTIAAGGAVTVHGYASTDGDATYNQHLSCARALETQAILEGNGVARGRIRVQRHGPTPGPVDERRSTTVEAPIAPTPPTPAPPTPAPPPTPLTVAFSTVNASSSPAAMSDRIPPRVDTIAAVSVVGFSPPMRPVTISVDGAGGANGDLTINGAASVDVTSLTTLRLRGTTQTGVGNAGNLRLVAEQGGTRLATSNDFSVSAIPQDWTITFSSLVTGARRGIIVDDSWESDSGVVADLDETEISEILDTVASSGSLAGVGVSTSSFLPGDTFTQDEHSSPATITATGSAVDHQTSVFNDRRSSAANIPMTNSGYRIVTVIVDVPLLPSIITTAKAGAAVTAGGVASGAGAGSVTRTQTIP